MKLGSTLSGIGILASALLISCSTRPVFDLQHPQLIPGKTTPPEARKLLGSPDRETHIINSDITTWSYSYNQVLNSGKIVVNQLTLNFKKDLLERYCYNWSSGKQLPRKFQIAPALESLKKGISAKADTIAALGEPSGKGGCRISIQSGTESVEIWYWTQSLDDRNDREVSILFNPSGVISEIKQYESKQN